MNIHVVLSQTEVECFRGHLPSGTALSRKFDESTLNYLHSPESHDGYSNIIECDEGEARALLRIAIEYCSDAVEKIQYGMRVAGVRFS
jgi:hypothetical protein